MTEPSSGATAGGKRLALCLSGGGLRATFFHLGVVRFLRDTDRLQDVAQVFSVSGGSILAAHLALRWQDYASPNKKKFDEAAAELIAFGQRDIRGRVVQQWLLASLFFGLPVLFPKLRRAALLQRQYTKLYGNKTLQDLNLSKNSGPEFHILATSLTVGSLCEFNKDGFLRDDEQDGPRPFKGELLPVSLAVAASSAFPPLFPPLPLSSADVGADQKQFFVKVEYLTDGGVFDNLGVWRARRIRERAGVERTIVSDASAAFDWGIDQKFSLIWQRTARSTDVLMNRLSTEEKRVSKSPLEEVIAISVDDVKSPEGVQPGDVQAKLKSVRTDLDAFTDDEVRALAQHGYEVAQKVLGAESPQPPWDPLSKLAHRETDALKAHLARSEHRKWGRAGWTAVAIAVVVMLVLAWAGSAGPLRLASLGGILPAPAAPFDIDCTARWEAQSGPIPAAPMTWSGGWELRLLNRAPDRAFDDVRVELHLPTRFGLQVADSVAVEGQGSLSPTVVIRQVHAGGSVFLGRLIYGGGSVVQATIKGTLYWTITAKGTRPSEGSQVLDREIEAVFPFK